jgi:hypothetical protein
LPFVVLARIGVAKAAVMRFADFGALKTTALAP